MNVESAMSREIIACSEQDTLAHCFRLMVDGNVSALPVVKLGGDGNLSRKLCGIITDRDLRLAADSPFLQRNAETALENLAKHKVGEIMNQSLITANQSDSLADAAKLMRVSKIAQAPVVDDKGNLVGMLSRTDFLDFVIRIWEPSPEG